jgi:hypothetical protein
VSQREEIVQNVIDTVAGIGAGIGNVYATKVNRVVRLGEYAGDFPGDGILVEVWESAYGWQNALLKPCNPFPATLQITMRATIRAAAKDAERVKGQLKDDIGKALYADRKRGLGPDPDDPDKKTYPVDTVGLQFTNDMIELSGSGALAMFVAVLTVALHLNPLDP